MDNSAENLKIVVLDNIHEIGHEIDEYLMK